MTEIVITSSVLIVVVLILRTVFKGRISNTARYALWLLVAARLVLPFGLVQSSASIMNLIEPKMWYHAGVFTDEIVKDKMPETGTISTGNMATDRVPTENIVTKIPAKFPEEMQKESQEVKENVSDQQLPIMPESKKISLNRSVSAKGIWLFAAGALLIWFIGVNIVFYFRLRQSRERLDWDCPLDVYVADEIISPCIFGFFRPAVYVTREAADDKEMLDFIVAHEYCHYRHGDMFWAVLRYVLPAVYWFHPLVWLAAVLAKRDCECACDEAAIRRIGESRRLEYGRALVAMVPKGRSGMFGVASTMMSSGGRVLKERIDFIAKKPKNMLPAVICSAVVLLLAAGCTFTSAKDKEGEGGLSVPENNTVSETEKQPASDMNYHAGDVIYSFEKEIYVRQGTDNVSRKFRVDFVMTSEDYPGGRVMADKNMLWGNFAFRVYDEDGNLKSEQAVVAKTGDLSKAIPINAAEDALPRYFALNRKSDNLIIFSDRCVYNGETPQYASLFYGITADGEIFPYHVDSGEFPEGIQIGGDRLLTGDFSYAAASQVLVLGENETADVYWYINYCSAKPSDDRDYLCMMFFDEQTQTVRNIYSVSAKRSEEVLAAAKKAMFIEYKLLPFSLNVPLRNGEIIEMVNEKENVGYCEVDRNLAVDKEELVEYIEDAFVGYPIDRFSSRAELEYELFEKPAVTFAANDGGQLPYFKMIDGKLCYLNEYRGAAGNPMDSIVTQKIDDETYRVIFCTHHLADVEICGYIIRRCGDGRWRVE